MAIDLVWMGEFKELPPTAYEPGWAFFHGPWASSVHLSNYFKAHEHRPPICIILPISSSPGYGTGFCLDCHPTDKPDEHWNIDVDETSLVVGQRPHITVSPSISCLGIWHGFLQDGVLGDDLDAATRQSLNS